ncbi:polyprenol monophosphomannose synthase [Myroides ceti]|uniref:Polyprenol monophosphomannose synthase n=1 Tax=Paenimyroides ceti TaxID=395087 RepID=A0ABT8CYG9_9FLAO|nr:polyprenol monophosphomannose synthase [Paenimyroides ceti]MDN3708235.1 polyprenol monophosphomannose synthase [Paenimyroides ceti]
MNKRVVVIPTYNEIENISDIISSVLSLPYDYDILVVDDNSPDGTSKAVERLMTQYPDRVFIQKRTQKTGLGTAYVHGFKWALKHNYDYIFEMDADFSHNPKDLDLLLEACMDGNDMTIGSRYVKGVNVVNWPLNRVLLSYFASVYVRFITGMKIHDTTAGFICYHRSVLESIPLDKIKFVGYAFQIEMKYRAFAKGFKIKEIPIIFTDRTKGASKMTNGIIQEAVFGVLRLRIKKLFNRL